MLDIDIESSCRETSSMQREHTTSHSVGALHVSDRCSLHIRIMYACMCIGAVYVLCVN